MNLGERLTAIAERVHKGSVVADIGTDHAYLPVYLLQQGIISHAIAGEINEGPFAAAGQIINRLKLKENIDLRFGSGFAVLKPGEADTVTIAGMGGTTIIDILTAHPLVTAELKRMILQPMIGASLVRQWLVQNGWNITDETLVEEEGKLYEIIVAEQGESSLVEPILYEIGPILWKNKPPLLTKHILQLIRQKQYVLSEMNASQKARQSDKFREYQEKLAQLEEKACQLAAN